ncbi:MAG: ChbG/HpnK family deacetylase [Bryobacteraceae bacterium]
MKRLIVNADDFGFTRDVNQGIIQAHRRGILTATTLMANGAAFDHAVQLARENPALDVGCHLVLVGSPGLPATLPQLALALVRRRIEVFPELERQVERILDAGIRPTHLDTHKHTHLLPAVLRAVARIAEKFSIPWVRRPFDFPLSASGAGIRKRAVSASFGLLRRRFERVLAAHHCRTTDYFAGFQITGEYDASDLSRLIHALPEGTTELMCHPGLCTAELQSARTRLKASREHELQALASEEVREALAESKVQLISYRDLG